MKSNLLMKACAIVLAGCVTVSAITAAQIFKVYATDDTNFSDDQNMFDDDQDMFDDDQDIYDDTDDDEPAPEPVPDDPDPFDYNLNCYTPNINFGSVFAGDVMPSKQFSIVNTGSTSFPLTWESIDQYTAFSIGTSALDLDLDPGDTIDFNLQPVEGLKSGTYSASYTFFSANDYRRHHFVKVNVTVTVKDAAPYVSSVTVTPSSVTLPAGKSYKFDVAVAGGNNYDPSVTWSLAGNQNSGTKIDSNGNILIAAGEPAGSFAVIATSKQNPSVYGRGIVTVTSVDYVISVKADPSDGGAVAGPGSVRAGSNATVSASPNNNFVFKGWYEGGNLVSNNGSFTINNIGGDRALIAKFERKTCSVKTGVNDTNGGTISGGGNVQYGGRVTLTAKANDGYSFAGFVENNKTISTAASLELSNITSDRNIVAVFNRNTRNVNVSVYPQDTGKTEGGGKVNYGSKVELKATAYDGFEFYGWSINGQVVCKDSKYVIDKVNNDVNVVANFMKKNVNTYKLVSGIATAGGSIVPSGDYTATEGQSVTYNIVPQAEYKITSVVVDGKNIGAVSSYTFNNVRGGHTITASFEKKPAAAPAQNQQSSQPAAKSSSQTQTQKKTTYNNNTAAQGAVPSQNVVDEKIPEQTEELEGEEYEDDVYTEAVEIEDEDMALSGSNGGVMARHDLDEETLRILIGDDAVKPMLREAIQDGTLQITVNNSYAANTQETSQGVEVGDWTLHNFDELISDSLSDDEKFAVLTGTPIAFNVDISENSEFVSKQTKDLMQTKVGYKPVSYFDFTIMKTVGGSTSIIENTHTNLEVVIPIPEEYRKEGRKFYVIREHNGVVDVLQDVGNDPNTVTFRTDRFSEYAIAYEALNINRLILRFAIVAGVSLILAVICYINLIKYRRRARKARRQG